MLPHLRTVALRVTYSRSACGSGCILIGKQEGSIQCARPYSEKNRERHRRVVQVGRLISGKEVQAQALGFWIECLGFRM